MNSSIQTSAADSAQSTEATPAVVMPEEQVVSFFRSKVARLAERTGVSYAVLSLEVGTGTFWSQPKWTAYVDNSSHVHGATVNEVIGKQVELMAPDRRAHELRERAKALLAEAETLSPAPIIA